MVKKRTRQALDKTIYGRLVESEGKRFSEIDTPRGMAPDFFYARDNMLKIRSSLNSRVGPIPLLRSSSVT
jgi:hypothetical protein